MLPHVTLCGPDGAVLLTFCADGTERCDSEVRTAATELLGARKHVDGTALKPFYVINGVLVGVHQEGSCYVLGLTGRDANAAAVLEKLSAVGSSLATFVGAKQLGPDDILKNAAAVYVLLRAMRDTGIMGREMLARYIIDTGIVDLPPRSKMAEKAPPTTRQTAGMAVATGGSGVALPAASPAATVNITGAVPWRKAGVVHKANEVYLEVNETVNATLAPTGEVLSADVIGAMVLTSKLSGMPHCRIGLNDTPPAGAGAGGTSGHGARLADVSFHPCVSLPDYSSKRQINFIPPDGKSQLLSYRATQCLRLPVLVQATGRKISAVHARLTCRVHAELGNKTLAACGVRVFLPLPPNATKVDAKVSGGKPKPDFGGRTLRWKIKELRSGEEQSLVADIQLMATTAERGWLPPPARVQFEVPAATASGLRIRFFTVEEEAGAQAGGKCNKWVRYCTVAGAFEVRLQ